MPKPEQPAPPAQLSLEEKLIARAEIAPPRFVLVPYAKQALVKALAESDENVDWEGLTLVGNKGEWVNLAKAMENTFVVALEKGVSFLSYRPRFRAADFDIAIVTAPRTEEIAAIHEALRVVTVGGKVVATCFASLHDEKLIDVFRKQDVAVESCDGFSILTITKINP